MKNPDPVQGLSQERLHERCGAPALERRRRIDPLCHEHHIEMRLMQVLLKTENEPMPTVAYVCPAPGCRVHYDTSRGYFVITQNENGIKRDMMPRVVCSQDGVRMYLAEVRPTPRSFRLWTCPQCSVSHRNQEHSLANNGTSAQAPIAEDTSEPTALQEAW
jgi:hypothetical protein